MAEKLIELNDAAKMLGVTPEQLSEMRSRNEIFGYRDGTTWKFKEREVERVASERAEAMAGQSGLGQKSGSGIDSDLDQLFDVAEPVSEKDPDSDDAIESILVSEEELGESGQSTSSTVIGKAGQQESPAKNNIELDDEDIADAPTSTGSDIRLATEEGTGSDVQLSSGGSNVLGAGSDVLSSSGQAEAKQPTGSDTAKVSGAEGADDLSLEMGSMKLGEQLSLEDDDDVKLGAGGSAVDLAAEEGDDDLVLGSGAGSDVTLNAGDSGISLASPSDSGLSLEEEPLELAGSSVEALELGEDDMITLGEEPTDPETDTQLKADDDFLLTPDEAEGAEEQDSGSQVIALGSEEYDQVTDSMLGSSAPALVAEGATDQAAPAAQAMVGGEPQLAPELAQEAEYSVWNVVSLTFITLLLMVTGIMMVDLMRHMWSWQQPYTLSSTFMDTIVGMLGQ